MDKGGITTDALSLRKDFPIYKNHPDLVYLDNSATSLTPQIVLDRMNDYYTNYNANINRGVYHMSFKATDEYEKAREKVAKFINSKDNEVIFTKSTTDSLNKVCYMYKKFLKPNDQVIVTELEHHSSVLPWQVASKELNLELTYIPLDRDGRITVENFKKVITERAKVLAITYVSNVMGYVTPLEEIIKIAHDNNMIVIVDAAQAIPHIKVDVRKLDCDFLAFSGHKMLGPTGIGILYGKEKILKSLQPVDFGGDMNEEVNLYDVEIKPIPHCFEAGTPAIAEAIGLGAAIDYLEMLNYEKILDHEKKLHKYALDKLSKIENVVIYNPTADIGVISFNIENLHPHDASSLFDERMICVRAGHHCAQLITKWLKCTGTIRASFYIYNTYEDVDKFVDAVRDTVDFFKKFEV
ncbi:MAG TPA: cysteine desulfurase [Acholeplasmataceae bacterium]|nr:cysteine desulfurase [Acholeplasmataceae bacterium]